MDVRAGFVWNRFSRASPLSLLSSFAISSLTISFTHSHSLHLLFLFLLYFLEHGVEKLSSTDAFNKSLSLCYKHHTHTHGCILWIKHCIDDDWMVNKWTKPGTAYWFRLGLKTIPIKCRYNEHAFHRKHNRFSTLFY